jgi:hypothetical protein
MIAPNLYVCTCSCNMDHSLLYSDATYSHAWYALFIHGSDSHTGQQHAIDHTVDLDLPPGKIPCGSLAMLFNHTNCCME